MVRFGIYIQFPVAIAAKYMVHRTDEEEGSGNMSRRAHKEGRVARNKRMTNFRSKVVEYSVFTNHTIAKEDVLVISEPYKE